MSGTPTPAIASMTGFAVSEDRLDGVSWRWEVRSVNGRGLDVRWRVPQGYERLEPRIREAVARHLTRGNVTLTLTVERNEGPAEIRVNEAALAQVLAAAERVRTAGNFDRPRVEGLLALRGVLEVVEPSEDEATAERRAAAILTTLEAALSGLKDSRGAEGRRLGAVIEEQLAGIEQLTTTIAALPARTPEAIRGRLREQVARLLEAGMPLDENRLYQEAALLAQRSDVEEELKRLQAHVAAARDLLATGQPAGRKLDFLAQEFNREANTVCSKANDIETTRAGLALKALIEQMREQVQNIE